MKSATLRILLTLSLTCLLQGCLLVASAAAGAAAVAMVYDHRAFQNGVEDTKLSNKIADAIHKLPSLRNECHIEVTSFNRIVLLTGQCPSAEWRQTAGDVTQSTPNVGRVYNQITVQGPTSSLTRTSDSWITTKIKGQMLATDDLKSSSIKVVTENGDVYLMGMVKREQADIAVDIAREVSGVQKVMKIFEYTN